MSEPAGYFSTSPSGAAAAAKLSGVAAAVAVILALLLFPMPDGPFADRTLPPSLGQPWGKPYHITSDCRCQSLLNFIVRDMRAKYRKSELSTDMCDALSGRCRRLTPSCYPLTLPVTVLARILMADVNLFSMV